MSRQSPGQIHKLLNARVSTWNNPGWATRMAPCRKPPHPQAQAPYDKPDTTTLRSGEVASTIGHPS
eukprot:8290812-Alexandrium_andersonii.AAC.1